ASALSIQDLRPERRRISGAAVGISRRGRDRQDSAVFDVGGAGGALRHRRESVHAAPPAEGRNGALLRRPSPPPRHHALSLLQPPQGTLRGLSPVRAAFRTQVSTPTVANRGTWRCRASEPSGAFFFSQRRSGFTELVGIAEPLRRAIIDSPQGVCYDSSRARRLDAELHCRRAGGRTQSGRSS